VSTTSHNAPAPNSDELALFWQGVRAEAANLSKEEPAIGSLMHARVMAHGTFPLALANILAHQLAHAGVMDVAALEKLFSETFQGHPALPRSAMLDIQATLERDPALRTPCEPLLLSKGFHALQIYRVAHVLWKKERRFMAQTLQSACSRVFGVDIHPAASIGHGILVDHATNLVIGETARVGNNVSMLHGVTLGGTGKEKGDRHPKVGDGVLLSAHAQLLGNIRIGRGAKIGAGAVVLVDVPAHTTYAGVPAVKVGRPSCDAPALEMDADFMENPGTGV